MYEWSRNVLFVASRDYAENVLPHLWLHGNMTLYVRHLVLSQYTRVTDRQTDRRTDRQNYDSQDRLRIFSRGKNQPILERNTYRILKHDVQRHNNITPNRNLDAGPSDWNFWLSSRQLESETGGYRSTVPGQVVSNFSSDF